MRDLQTIKAVNANPQAYYDKMREDKMSDAFYTIAQEIIPANLKHFSASVPLDMREKMLEVAEHCRDELGYHFEGHGCTHLDPIHGNSYDGFIAFTNGGFNVTEFVSMGDSTGTFFNKAHEEWRNEQYDYMIECFRQDELKWSVEDAKLQNGVFDWESLTESEQEMLTDYENEWFEPPLVSVRMFIKEGRVYTLLLANYSDAPYYRGSAEDVLAERDYSYSEFRQLLTCDVMGNLLELYNKAEY